MRLIDADKFKGKIIAGHCYSGVNKLINVDDVPTAYDVDKVVEQLKNVSYERFGNAGMDGENVVNLDDAIEIIKAGGIDDKK